MSYFCLFVFFFSRLCLNYRVGLSGQSRMSSPGELVFPTYLSWASQHSSHPALGQAWRSASTYCGVPCPQSILMQGACLLSWTTSFLVWGVQDLATSAFISRDVPEWNENLLPVAHKLLCHCGGGGYFSLDVKVLAPHCSHPGTPASRLTGLSVSVSVAARCIVSSRVEHGALSGQDLILGTCWGKGPSGGVPQGAPLTSSGVGWLRVLLTKVSWANGDYCLPQNPEKGDEPKRIICLLKCLKTKVKKILLVMVFFFLMLNQLIKNAV